MYNNKISDSKSIWAEWLKLFKSENLSCEIKDEIQKHSYNISDFVVIRKYFLLLRQTGDMYQPQLYHVIPVKEKFKIRKKNLSE